MSKMSEMSEMCLFDGCLDIIFLFRLQDYDSGELLMIVHRDMSILLQCTVRFCSTLKNVN